MVPDLAARDAQTAAILEWGVRDFAELARLTIYPDANHGFLFQYPHEFAAEVNAFLAE